MTFIYGLVIFAAFLLFVSAVFVLVSFRSKE